jgi:hypothetical protein
MKPALTGIFAGAVLCGISLAQDAAPQQNSAPPQGQPRSVTTQSAQPGLGQARTPRVAPGSVIPGQLTKTIDAQFADARVDARWAAGDLARREGPL